MQIINRPKWWVFLLFIPVINLLLLPVIWIESLRTFGKKSTLDMILGVATFGLYIGFVNYTQEVIHEKDRDLKSPNKIMDNLGSIVFAIIVATLAHTYIMQPFVIPTSSLEKTLLKGDFLLVSKFHYGARTPYTPIAAPMVHDTLPFIKTKSYLSKPQLPAFRFPGIANIKRNDIVVFNWPADTLYNMYKTADKRYDKPIDKKTNYVKRCTAIPGDVLEIKNGVLYVNNKPSILPERAKIQYSYTIEYDNTNTNTAIALQEKLNQYESTDGISMLADNKFVVYALTKEGAETIKTINGVKSIVQNNDIAKSINKGIFPGNQRWTMDNFGPIKIPSKGDVITLTESNYKVYEKIINEYEQNTFQKIGNQFIINNKKTNQYTIQQNYYWMMGDNRHNSLDSRAWGFVPDDHIVGKPVFVWLSIEGIELGLSNFKNWRPRWDRMFTVVHGDGLPNSYLKHFLVLLAIYFAWDYWKNKKKKKQAEENL
jgi:signal peptidase I